MKHINRKENSIFWKYFYRNLIFYFIPVIVFSCLTVGILFDFTKKDMTLNLREENLRYSAFFENVEKQANDIYETFYNNRYLKSVVLSDAEFSKTQEFVSSLTKVQEIVENRLITSEYVASVYIVNNQTKMVYSNYQNEFLNEFIDKNWVKRLNVNDRKPFVFRNSSDINGRIREFISFTYPLNYSNRCDGYIAVNIDINKLKTGIQEKYNKDVMYIIDKDEQLSVFSTKEETFPVAYSFEESEVFKVGLFKQKSAIKIFRNHFCFVSEKNEGILYNQKFILFISFVFLYTLILGIVIYQLAHRYANHYYKNIIDVLNLLDLYNDESNALESKDEFQHIKDNIVDIIEQNTKKEYDLSKRMVLLKETQLVALQTQISPHFILNALNVINLMIMKTGDLHNDAAKMTQLLSEVISNILSTNGYIIPIEQEIKYAKKYLEIEQIKSNNGYNIEWFIENECLSNTTLKFVLQPILENALHHGLNKTNKKDKNLSINIFSQDNDIVFEIKDNGNGMTAETLAEIEADFNISDINKQKHMALPNVHKRLKIIYGEPYGVKILKSNSEGTDILIMIPKTS